MQLSIATAVLLQDCMLFKDIEASEIIELLSEELIECKSFDSRSVLVEYGSDAKHLGIIISGRVEVVKPTAKGRLPISVLEPCMTYGMNSLFSDEKSATELIAKGSCQVIIIDEAVLRRLMQRSEKLFNNYMEYLTKRIHFLVSRVEALAGTSVESKLLSYLETNSVDGICTLKYSMEKLATALGTSRASLYRAMDILSENNIIKRNGKVIYIISNE